MIRKLKTKFIFLASAILLALLCILTVGMNVANRSDVVRQADELLTLLSQSGGSFPMHGDARPENPFEGLPSAPHMSPETPYETRYFSVVMNEEEETIEIDTNRIISVDKEQAKDYALLALHAKRERGFIEDYRYLRYEEGENTRIVFLDCGRKLEGVSRFLLISITVSLLGFAVYFVLIFFLSGRVIRPIAEGYEKQKRFITDAGHEIKTPLAIISANTDLLEMDVGENEAIDEIRTQTKRLSVLTKDLVTLARLEETAHTPTMIDFPLSEVVKETAAPFTALAEAGGKRLALHIEPMLTLHGDSASISRLVSLLLDNALKYSPVSDTIRLALSKQGKSILLTVSNRSALPITEKEAEKVFDRFYRGDPSRGGEIGGHGIGLSIAKALVASHNGKITAKVTDHDLFSVTAAFPLTF